jgi:hypothetical protein
VNGGVPGNLVSCLRPRQRPRAQVTSSTISDLTSCISVDKNSLGLPAVTSAGALVTITVDATASEANGTA